MPKLSKEELKNIKYVSMADYMQKIDQLEDFDDKLEFTTRYLLSHGMNGAQTDYSLDEAIHLARMKIVDASKKVKDKLAKEERLDEESTYLDQYPSAVNPNAKTEKEDIENEFFLANPGEFLKAKAKQFVKKSEEKDMDLGADLALAQNCDRLMPFLNGQKSREIISQEGRGMATLNIKARMEAKYKGREGLENVEKMVRPSFFTRLFGTRSNPGRNFDEVYAAFNNPKHALYGNLGALEKATSEYLAYKDSKKSPAERAVGLAMKEPKEGFALRLMDAIKDQKENDVAFKPTVNAAARKNLTEESVNSVKGVEAEVNPHRIPIVLDLDENEESLDDSFESERELEKENEIEQQAPANNQ